MPETAITPDRESASAGLIFARAVECAVLFAGVPLLIYFGILPLRLMMLVLGIFGLVVFLILIQDRTFDNKRLWNNKACRSQLTQIVPIFFVAAILLVFATAFHDYAGIKPRLLFSLLSTNPILWIAIMCLYPLFSVYPQELLYRAFFFHRYAILFRTPASMIIASALAFGWAHLIFENVLAVALSTAGGLLFAWTYHRSKSLAACWLEHALYGDWLFTVGLGWYFFTGSVGM